MNFSDADRLVFGYDNGQQKLFADPLAAERKLRALTGGKPGEVAAKTNDAELDDAAWAQAEEKLIAAVREAFEMVPFDKTTGKGATDAMCKRLWNEFWGYLQKKSPPLAG